MTSFLKRNIPSGFFFIGTLLLAYFEGFYNWDEPFTFSIKGQEFEIINRTPIFFAIIFLIVVGGSLNLIIKEIELRSIKKTREKNELLQAENEELTERLMAYFHTIVRDSVQQLYDELEYSDKERITVYKVEDEFFWPIGRVSENHDFREFRRQKYPKDQGCISIAWEKGEANDNRAPEELDKWLAKQERKWSIPPEISKQIRMKSRSLFAIRINETSNDRKALVVIVFESLRPQKLSQKNCVKIKELLEQNMQKLERTFCDYHEYGPSQKTIKGSIDDK